MNKLTCWIKTQYTSLLSFIETGNATPISGHNFGEEEVHENVKVSILTCQDCGHVSIMWEL